MHFGDVALPFCLVMGLATAGLAKDSEKLGPVLVDPSPYPPISDDGYWPAHETVAARFIAAYADECGSEIAGRMPNELQPEVWELRYHMSFDADQEPTRRLTLYRFACTSGAYNFFDVYMAVTEYRGITGLEFAEPMLSADFLDGVEAEGIIEGFEATEALVNSAFNPETLTISSHYKWRGIGDASSGGVYELVEDRFVLRTYEVDASYDGAINPELVFDHGITR